MKLEFHQERKAYRLRGVKKEGGQKRHRTTQP